MNRTLNSSKIIYSRTLLVICGLVYPAWSIGLFYFLPETHDSPIERAICGALAFFAVGFSYFSEKTKNHLDYLVAIIFLIVTLHYHKLAFESQMSFVYCYAGLVVSAVLSLPFLEFKTYVVYTTLCLTIMALNLSYFDIDHGVRFMVFSGIATIHTTYFGLILQQKRIMSEFTALQTNNLQLKMNALMSELEAASWEAGQYKFEALHDPLTKLGNRKLVISFLDSLLTKNQKNSKTEKKTIFGTKEKIVSISNKFQNSIDMISVMFIDLDGFKQVNDSNGHDVGDNVLIHFSNILKSITREHDIIGRIGGDEFIVITQSSQNEKTTQKIGKELLNRLKFPLNIKDGNYKLGASIGVSSFISTSSNNSSEISASKLIKQADQAMYIAKSQGKNQIRYYNIETNNKNTANAA